MYALYKYKNNIIFVKVLNVKYYKYKFICLIKSGRHRINKYISILKLKPYLDENNNMVFLGFNIFKQKSFKIYKNKKFISEENNLKSVKFKIGSIICNKKI